MKTAYAAQKIKAVVKPFLAEMDLALGAATVSVSRSGASSLAEIAAMRLPSLLVPYPTAADNHQYINALAFEKTGAAKLLEQKNSTPEKVAAILSELVEDESARAKIQSALAQWHAPKAAEQIAEIILSAIAQRGKVGAIEGEEVWLRSRAGGKTRALKHDAAADILESPMRTEANIADKLAACVSRATVIRRDEPMAKHTTMRIGGPADVYVEPASEADLANVLKFCCDRDMPFFILGRGSNLLVRDGGVRGVVICLAHPYFSKIEVGQASCRRAEAARCGAGAKLKNVSVEAKRNNLSGVEFLEGIPGSVGGALRMNAGAMGAATFDAVESLRFMDHAGEIHERVANEVPVEYRACPLLENAHRARRGVQMHAAAARGDRAADEGVQRKALGIAARRAERRLHLQESGHDSGGQADGRTRFERHARGWRDGFRRAWKFHRERRQGDGARRFGIDCDDQGARRRTSAESNCTRKLKSSAKKSDEKFKHSCTLLMAMRDS